MRFVALVALFACAYGHVSSSPMGVLQHAVGAQPNSQYTAFVSEFGAVGDGKTDNTAAFQACLDSFVDLPAKAGTCIAEPGQYLFSGSLKLPVAVSLMGSYVAVPSHNVGQGGLQPDDGTVLLPTGGRGEADGTPFITLQDNSVLRGLVIYHIEQQPDRTPVAYPWTIDMTGNNPAVEDVELLNPYQGIRAVGSARHYVARVQGQPLLTGMLIDETYDIGRIYSVHFNPWWSNNINVTTFQAKYGRAFVFGRADWEMVAHTFAYCYAVGYHFIETDSGSTNGAFDSIGMDLAFNASVLVDASQPAGLLISNGEFTAFNSPDWCADCTAQPRHVVVTAGNTGPVRFITSAFWGPAHQIALLQGSGTTGFGDCVFVQWNGEDGAAAIQAEAGNVLVRGCEFQQDGPQAELATTVAKAVIVGNIFAGDDKVVDHGAGVVEKGLNA